jgi:nucleolin
MSKGPISPASFTEVTLFLGNLPFSLDETSLRELLIEKGLRVSVVKIPSNVDGSSKGFGFATILTRDAGEDILSLYGVEIDGRPIRVALSEESRESLRARK